MDSQKVNSKIDKYKPEVKIIKIFTMWRQDGYNNIIFDRVKNKTDEVLFQNLFYYFFYQ
jgi:hypothetical protein